MISGNSVTIRNITAGYRSGAPALKDASIGVESGEFLCILGPSGCGKSTLLKVISGILTPTHGSVEVGGKPVDHLPMEKRNIGFVFQNYALFPHMTVASNIAYGLQAKGLGKAQVKARVGEMLELTGLSELASRFPRQLSGGQQQRTALARAIAPNPSVLLLDEPLSALDESIRQKLRVDLRRIQKDLGLTTLFVTHDQEESFELGDRVVVMNGGIVEQTGTPEEIYDRPRSEFVARFVGSTNILKGRMKGSKVYIGTTGLYAETGYPQGTDCLADVYVRPEDIILQNQDMSAMEGGGDIAMISETRFLGPIMNLLLTLEDGIVIMASVPKERVQRKGFHAGERVAVWIRPNHVIPVGHGDESFLKEDPGFSLNI